jgi:hypothetical protein
LSRRDMPDHDLRMRILAALTHGAADPARALAAAAAYLRGQGLRVKTEELEAVLAMPLRDILFPGCTCDQAALPLEGADRDTLGPHHGARCPKWRAVRA